MMLRSNSSNNNPNEALDDGQGLGPHLVGRQLDINGRTLAICKQIGEGGFSFVYLVRDKDGGSSSSTGKNDRESVGSENSAPQHQQQQQQYQQQQPPQPNLMRGQKPSKRHSRNTHTPPPYGASMVLKITSVHTATQRHMAEKEAKLLRTLSHPSIVQIYDHGFIDPNYSYTSTVGNSIIDEAELDSLVAGAASSALESLSVDNLTHGNNDHNSTNNNNANNGTHYNKNSNSFNSIRYNNDIKGPHKYSNRSTQHLILMEYCEGGTAYDAIKRMRAASQHPPPTAIGSSLYPNSIPSGPFLSIHNNHQQLQRMHNQRFDLPSLVIAFGQICNAVSYLHAQRPPIIHRDLKPVNFLIKNGAYKLCDFGSAILGHVDLRTPENRQKAEEVISKTTTQMFRAPEMVDLYMSKRLTQSTDVWALGCCLYSLAFLRDCFEEGSNLAILSRKYKIPKDNPYGAGVVELIDRMLTVDYKERADMSEVIMCLSALYSNRDLPKRKKREGTKIKEEEEGVDGNGRSNDQDMDTPRVGAYRTDGQGIRGEVESSPLSEQKKIIREAKKLNPNSAAAKRKKASEGQVKQKENDMISPLSHLSGGGATASLDEKGNASIRSETPCVDTDFGKFAAFDQIFEDNFDPFHGDSMSNDDRNLSIDSKYKATLCSDFDRSCSVSGSEEAGERDHDANSSFEVTFEGFGRSACSEFLSENDYFFDGNTRRSDEEFERVDGISGIGGADDNVNIRINSPPKKFNLLRAEKDVTLTMSGKKKRGFFGILGKR